VSGCPEPVFNSDYRHEHNRKYHLQLLSANKSIPFETLNAPKNPFVAAAAYTSRKKRSSTTLIEVLDQVRSYQVAKINLKNL
jgi:hypothetical protein